MELKFKEHIITYKGKQTLQMYKCFNDQLHMIMVYLKLSPA